MRKRQYSIFHTYIQDYAASSSGAEYLSRNLHHFDKFFLKMTKGRTTLTSILTGLPVVVLTTKGAKSGQPRISPVLYISDTSDPTKFAVIASNWGQDHHPAWYYNLKAEPSATVSINGQVNKCIAHEAEGEEYARFWQSALDTFTGFPLYKRLAGERRTPIMVLEPERPSSLEYGEKLGSKAA